METLRSMRGAPTLPARTLGGRPRLTAVAAVQTKQADASTSRSASPQEEIYIGFTKDEGALARAGRKGRVIRDDPRKYPTRDAFGTGGWAGGEAGLWQLREEVLKEKEKAKATKPQPPKSSPWIPKSAPPGKEVIYVGFNKDELELRKSGAKGRVVVDDPTKYPGKDDIGPLAGVAGGFAGGEAGLKQYVATGTVRLRKPGEPGPRQFSPLTLAGLIALAGAVGGIVLDLVTDAGAP